MTFRQMELFAAVCEFGSINKASAAYHLSQQGISKMVRELEAELGCKLLNRDMNGVTPTQYGAYLLKECQVILEKKNFICSHILQVQDASREVIHLGMAFGIISALPYWLISGFEKAHPYVQIEYADHTDFYLETLLKKDEFDFCITTGVMDGDRFSTELLLKEPVYLCIPRTHELYGKDSIQMADLREQRYAMFNTQFHIRHHFDAACRNAGFEPRIEISSGDFNSLKEIAQYHNLLFVVPKHTIRTDDPVLRYYQFPDEKFTWDIYFVKKKNKVLTENMEMFLNYVKRQILYA